MGRKRPKSLQRTKRQKRYKRGDETGRRNSASVPEDNLLLPVPSTSAGRMVVAACEPLAEVEEPVHALADTTTVPVPRSEIPTGPLPGTSNMSSIIESNYGELAQLLKCLANSGLPSTIHANNNMVPEFDPSIKSHKIHLWLDKVNECAKIYNWNEAHTTHYALQKLVGNAKKWYEGQTTVSHNWTDWQILLRKAFPSETNYGVLLSEMLERRLKFGESLDEYYYEKIILLNACEITGKRAVDCLIHGIDDRTIRAGASSARFTEPEDLLKFLKDVCKESKDIIRTSGLNRISRDNRSNGIKSNETGYRSAQFNTDNFRNTQRSTSTLVCFNCKQQGHRVHQCQKPIMKCDDCKKFGHTSKECPLSNQFMKKDDDKRVLFVGSVSKNNLKYHKKNALINNKDTIKCFIDLGSDCTLITRDTVSKLDLYSTSDNLPYVRGVANVMIPLLGKTFFKLRIDYFEAEITAYVVDDVHLHMPLLVGQNFTELPEVIIIKNDNSLNILSRDLSTELPSIEIENYNKDKCELHILSDSEVKDIGLITCYSNSINNGDVYVHASYRDMDNQKYYIQEGVYRIIDGKCKIIIKNLSESMEKIYFVKDLLIMRAHRIYPDCQNKYLRCLKAGISLEPLNRNDINLNPELSNEQKILVFDLIDKFRCCFAQNLSELGCTNLTELEIKLNDPTPVVYRPYRMSHAEKEIVRDMVTELKENNIIEESDSAYASPILLVTKKTGGYRLCVDYRALNRKIVRDLFPLPRIDDQIDRLNGCKFFITLDMSSGYYQIPIKDTSKHLTSFITPEGLYQFRRAPFGLANCPAVFQRTVNKMLGKGDNCALAYMDDLLISGKSFKECIEKLEQTFILLKDAGLTLNASKCRFFDTVINYLGFEISADGVRPGNAKIEAVNSFPEPSNVHEVRQFVGLASFFRKFIENFASIARPLTDLTKKHTSWTWAANQREAFNVLKQKLIQRPILAIYSPEFITELHCDASKNGLGGILFQKSNDNLNLRPVAYFSRKTTIDEEKLHAYELETLAVVASLNRFRVYLLGKHFTIVTDCSALRATFSKRDLIPRVARWWIALQEYDCSIEYRPGRSMQHVDALSRNSLPCFNDNDKLEHFSRVLNISTDDWLLSLQLSDPKIQHIRAALEDTQYKEIADIKQNFVLKNNRIYRKIEGNLKWVVPKNARWQICQRNHDDIGHFSVAKTLEKIKKDFWFPKMKKFVTKYVKSCLHCAFGKEPSGPKEGYLHSIPKINIPYHTVHVDHLGPFIKSTYGNQYLLLIIDGFTKFVVLKPLRNTKSTLTIKALKEVFYTFGYPSRLISDRGSCFTSAVFKRFCTEFEVRHVLNAVSSPRANGQVERYNRTILDSLRASNDSLSEKAWDQSLGKIQWGLNNTLNKGIGKTPAEALFCRRPLNKGEGMLGETIAETRHNDKDTEQIRREINEHIVNDQLHQEARFNKVRKDATRYAVGDLVKILKNAPSNDGKSKKLLPKYTGPFKITKILNNDRYEVSTIPGSTKGKYTNIWAVDRIQPWITLANDESDSSEDELNLHKN